MTSHTQPKRQVYDGAWSEVKPFTETLPPDCHVRLVIQEPEITDEEEQERLNRLFEEFFKETEKRTLTPRNEPPSPMASAVLEKFRRKGLRP